MRLIDAMTLRDGGTTSVTVTQGFAKPASYTIDYSLPWDGRKRYVFRGPAFSNVEALRLEIGCEEEKKVQHWLTQTVAKKYGDVAVREFLAGRGKNPGRGKWFYVMNFLQIMAKERCQQEGAANGSQPIRSEKNRKHSKPLMLICGVLLLTTTLVAFGLRAWRRSGAEEYHTFASPDGRFQIVVYRIPMRSALPGQGSDAPGYFQLRDRRTGRVLRERAVEMVQLVDRIDWSPTNVDIRLLADWSLPQ